eukprot:comp5233_c0_seq1/m.1269 comp5233_c0_seq1/g.1269  ORF comp5233_c0_seq1/g.1269 comp5233_c0_seq1/m.1269 type:complete len:183 (-) comp5233_c0_seq1:658-1206(-)
MTTTTTAPLVPQKSPLPPCLRRPTVAVAIEALPQGQERRVSFSNQMTVGTTLCKKDGNRKAWGKRDLSKKAIKQLEELNRELFPDGNMYGDSNCYDPEFLTSEPKRHSFPVIKSGTSSSPQTDRRLSAPEPRIGRHGVSPLNPDSSDSTLGEGTGVNSGSDEENDADTISTLSAQGTLKSVS